MSKGKSTPGGDKPARQRERPVVRRGSAWPAIIAATALPVLGGLAVFGLVASGKARFDQSFFFGNLAKFAVGGMCLGIVLSVIWAVIAHGSKLSWFQKVNVPIIVVGVSLFGFYFCAPDTWTEPVTAVLRTWGDRLLDALTTPPAAADNAANLP
ncbi:MAG: hypothetical protein AB7K09_23475 [Planctomycetota bacterium]